MFQRKFKNIEEKPSILGFGCMRLPLLYEGKSDIDYAKASRMIDEAIANGVNYFDTAYPYHEGKSEIFIGEVLKKYPRSSFYLADKLPIWEIHKEEDVERIFEEQLQKCQVEYFDFYLAHALNKQRCEALSELRIYEILMKKKKEGKIKNLGFSFHDTPDVCKLILDTFEWDFAQIQLNYLDWELQNSKDLYGYIAEKGIPCIIMEPVRGGTLATLSDEAVEILHQADAEASTASWAIRYAASFPNVMTVLSGMSTLDQVKDNLKTTTDFRELTKEERQVLEKALEAFKTASIIPCTGCRYCMDCPSGVDIPGIFTVYNKYLLSKHKEQFKAEYQELGEASAAHNCVECGICMEQCPQGIGIPNYMKEIAEFAKEIG